jgi:hypothetical protein
MVLPKCPVCGCEAVDSSQQNPPNTTISNRKRRVSLPSEPQVCGVMARALPYGY